MDITEIYLLCKKQEMIIVDIQRSVSYNKIETSAYDKQEYAVESFIISRFRHPIRYSSIVSDNTSC